MIEQAVSLTEIAAALRDVSPRHATEFVAAQKIGDLVHDNMQGVWWEDRREHEPYSYYGRTEQGLIIVRGRDGRPNLPLEILLTPWGEKHTMGSRLGVLFDTRPFLERVKLKQRAFPPAGFVTFAAHLGEYFNVTSVEGVALPPASLKRRGHNNDQPGIEWQALKDRYDSLAPGPKPHIRTRR